MAQPVVSIVVPSYNHASFLGECIQAVIDQTFTDWELIIVDDQSPDDSVEVARSFNDARISVTVNEKNLGTYGNLNKAISLASGEFLAVLNSDDKWKPTKLEKQVSGLRKYPQASFSYHLGFVADENGNRIESIDQHSEWPREELQNPLPRLFEVNRILASSTLWRGREVRFDPSLRFSGDWSMALTGARRGLVHFVNEELSIWRHHGDNMSKKRYEIFLEDIRFRRAVLDHLDSWFVPHTDIAQTKKWLGACAILLHGLYIAAGDRQGASWALRKARKLMPGSKTVLLRSLAPVLPQSMVTNRIMPGWDIERCREVYRQNPPQLDLQFMA